MRCLRSIPRKDADGIIFCGRPKILSRWPNGFEEVLNGIMIRAEVECRKVRLFYAALTSLEHWVSEESAPTEYLYSSSDGTWVTRWQANRSYIIYFVTGYRFQNLFNLGERAYWNFYYYALKVFMNKRLTLTPTANFASQHLQLHSSLGCVQPCTVYHNPFYLESIVDKPHHRRSQKLMPRCWDLSI